MSAALGDLKPADPASRNDGYFAAYGLRIRSDLVLPHFSTAEPGESDVIVRLGVVPKGLPKPSAVGPHWEAAQGDFLFRAEDNLRFRVTGGSKIMVECTAGGDKLAATYLMGSAWTALLQQRGLITLHSSAVCTPQGAVLFLGRSGAGKSTLAAALAIRGYEMLADDVVAVSAIPPGPPRATPGYPNLRLWADAFERLGLVAENRCRVRDGIDKYLLPADRFAGRPQTIRAAYVLRVGTTDSLEIGRATSAAAVRFLWRHTHRRRYVDGFGNLEKHFNALTHIARKVPVTRITRPACGVPLDDLIEFLEQDLSGSPQTESVNSQSLRK